MRQFQRSGYRGWTDGNSECYYGIQYAEVGSDARFEDSSVLLADQQLDVAHLDEVPIFPQLPSRLVTSMGRRPECNPQSESAHFLNIWVPAHGSNVPVLLFIHGGAWMTGGGSIAWYDGEMMSLRGAIVVTINYRLGPLAHLRDPAGTGSRNPAYSDICSALLWVQENIVRFGGDPGRVTVVGQSAGSWYAHLLTISPRADGLFDRVAHLSHASNRPWTFERQDQISMDVRDELGESSLMDIEPTSLLSGARLVLGRSAIPQWSVPTPFLPATEDSVADVFCDPTRSASASHVSAVYFRTTGTETSTFYFDSLNSHHLSHATEYEDIVAHTSELHFDGPARRLADAYSAQGTPTFLRRFNLRSELPGFLSGHCFDLPFQFGNLDSWSDAPMLAGVTHEKFEKVSDLLMSELVHFVEGAIPAGDMNEHSVGARAEPILTNRNEGAL